MPPRMTDPAPRLPMRLGEVVLGLLLAPTGVGVILGVLLDVLPSIPRLPSVVLAAVLAVLVALVAAVVTGIHLLVVGTGGGGGHLTPARRWLRTAVRATGVAVLVALFAFLVGGRRSSPGLLAGAALVSAVWAAASFPLARRLGRATEPDRADGAVLALAVAATPLLAAAHRDCGSGPRQVGSSNRWISSR